MSLERHDWSEVECSSQGNVNYVNNYMNWITPQVYGVVCDLGSGLGYPTARYANKPVVEKVVTNDKFFDEVKTVKHDKILRFVLTTEDFIKETFESKFDCIIATEHIEHLTIETQFKVLDWVKANLKEGGLFLGSMPDVERSTNPYHIQEYTHNQWEEILRKYFRDVEVVTFPELYVWKAKI